jgi:hypothetical protein
MLTKFQDWLFLTVYAQGTTPIGGSNIEGNTAKDQKLNFDLFNFAGRDARGVNADTIFGSLIGRIMGWVLVVVALVAFIYLVVNGVKYITAGGDAAKATEARTGILNAIIGLIVVILAYVILRFAGGLGVQLGTGL